MMAAQAKGYVLPDSARSAVVRIAAELAACTVKDVDVCGGLEDEAEAEDNVDETEKENENQNDREKHRQKGKGKGTDAEDPLCNLAVACAGLAPEVGPGRHYLARHPTVKYCFPHHATGRYCSRRHPTGTSCPPCHRHVIDMHSNLSFSS
jgi:hypothetical protein